MPRSVGEIREELRSVRARLKSNIAHARELQGKLAGMAIAVRRRGANLLNSQYATFVDQCEKARDPSAFNWKHPIWADVSPSDRGMFLEQIRVGGISEGELLPGELEADLPVGVPMFEGNGPIIIRHDDSTKELARNTLQSLLLRTALLMPGRIRFTLLDPTGMGAAYPFRGFLARDVVRQAGRSAVEELEAVLADIRRINEQVLADAPRFSALSPEQRSGENFETIAVADFPRAYSRDPRAVESLVKVANAGPRAGRHVVFEWNTDVPLPHDFSEELLANSATIDVGAGRIRVDTLPEGPDQKRLIDRAFDGARRREGSDWNAVVRPHQLFEEKASDRVLTPIGERLKFWLGENEDGKPSAHAMVAGQTGSGKSCFLHVLVTGLAARYPPEELRFTLIDGKQGVEFEAYRTLPHVDVVCLRTAPALARSVLADFIEEMRDRYQRFLDVGVNKLKDYRIKTGQSMPRRLLVVDEYQQILNGDPETGALLLCELLEKGRAAGMHAVLCSQTFEQSGLPQAALTHIHTWAALSLSESYTQSLQIFGNEGKRLIGELAPNGEVVLNDASGSDGANSRGAVARLHTHQDEGLLAGIIEELTNSAGGTQTSIVLSGDEGALISDNEHISKPRTAVPEPDELQQLARRSIRDGGFGLDTWNKADRPVPLWLGRRFDVRGHALCALRRAPCQNLLILGSDTAARNRMLSAGLAACGAILPPEALEVTLLDGLSEDMPGGHMLKAGLERLSECGVKVNRVEGSGVDGVLAELAETVTTANQASPSRLLIIAEPDYIYELHGGADRFSAPASGPTASLRTILQRGPQAGLHTIITTSGLTTFQLVFSPSREASLFNHRVVQQMNEEDSMTLFSSLMAAQLNERAGHPFACLHVDQIAGARNAVLFNSYCAGRSLGGDQSLAMLKSELERIDYPGNNNVTE